MLGFLATANSLLAAELQETSIRIEVTFNNHIDTDLTCFHRNVVVKFSIVLKPKICSFIFQELVLWKMLEHRAHALF